MSNTTPVVRQLRLVLAVDDLDAALRFYAGALGLPERAAFSGDGDARVAILEVGEATLELANRAQVAMIDRIETEGGTSDDVRVAFEVDDAADVTTRLADAGARLEAAPRETPWRSLNARLRAPDGVQLTLFQELETAESRTARPGFGRAGAAPAAADPTDAVAAVLARERELQTPAARGDRARVSDLLAPDATEIGASGCVWSRDELVDLLSSEPADAAPIELHDLRGRALGPDLVQVTWTSERAGRRAHRTSLWRRDATGWLLFHHQATPVPRDE